MTAEEIKYIVENKHEVIRLKKAVTKECDCIEVVEKTETTKEYRYDDEDNDNVPRGTIKRHIVGNTYGIMDSHDDVHIEGIFTKSLNENKQNVLHLHDHLYQLDAKVGTFEDIIEKDVLLSDLGINRIGSTKCLIGISRIRKDYNENIFNQYLNDEINQHSVGMRYVNLFLCVNNANYKEEYANWNKYINKVINRDKAEQIGMFWAVTEAKLIEISSVIKGSNEITPTLKPTKPTKQEPVQSTQKSEETSNFINLVNNFKIFQ